MTRPSRNHDQMLIETAKKLLPKVGVSGMSLKMVADEAGVNLGMFHYYFKSKANFIRKVLESLSEDMHQGGNAEISQEKKSIDRLRASLTSFGKMFRDQKKFVITMYRDLLNQEPEIAEFMIRNAEKRMQFLFPLIEECKEDGYVNKDLSYFQISSFCMAAVNFPILLADALERIPGKKLKIFNEIQRLDSDKAIEERVEMALKAISKNKK